MMFLFTFFFSTIWAIDIHQHEKALLMTNVSLMQNVNTLFHKFDATIDLPFTGITDADISDIHCLLRTFVTVELANPPNPDLTNFCAGRGGNWVPVTPTSLGITIGTGILNRDTIPGTDIKYVQNEYLIGYLHALWWKDNTRHLVAFRHQESASDFVYAAQRYSYEGAVIKDWLFFGHKYPSWFTSTFSSLLKVKGQTKYTIQAKKFINDLVANHFIGGDTLIVTGYSLGGGLAQVVGLDPNVNPQPIAVLSFAGNGPITKKNRNHFGAPPIINFVDTSDDTQLHGCHADTTQVCTIKANLEHEDFVYGRGPKVWDGQLTTTAGYNPPNPLTHQALYNGIFCISGDDYNALCGRCRAHTNYPDPASFGAVGDAKRVQGEWLIRTGTPQMHRLCEWSTPILQRKALAP